MLLVSSIDVLAEDSAVTYTAFREHWEQHLSRAGCRLDELSSDLELADVPYLPLAGYRAAQGFIVCPPLVETACPASLGAA